MRRASAAIVALGAVGALFAGCGGLKDDVVLVFPDQASHGATTVIATTAFEPFLYPADMPLPELIQCKDIGVFPPTRIIDPDSIAQVPTLGHLLTDVRSAQTFPVSGDWSVQINNPKQDLKNNPWGAILVYIEARGEVRAPQAQGGGQVQATLLAGCYCVSTTDGSHPDHGLDQAVKAACPPIQQNAGKAREVMLNPVIDPVFSLNACGNPDLAAPKKALISPGPQACVRTQRCDDAGMSGGGTGTGTGPGGTMCFRCPQPCMELSDMRNVPILFTVDQPNGMTDPKSQVVLTDMSGRSDGQITVDDCTTPIKVSAEVLGMPGKKAEFEVTCVPPVNQFTCDQELRLPPGREPTSITTLPGGRGQPDVVAIMYDTGGHTYVEVRGAAGPGGAVSDIPLASLEFPGETARQIKGYMYQLGPKPQDASRPVLAVATSSMLNGRETLELRFFEWTGSMLLPRTPNGRPFTNDCPNWECMDSNGGSAEMPVEYLKAPCNNPTPMCGTRTASCTGTRMSDCSCSSSSFAPCGCRLMLEFQTDVTLDVADLDNDMKSDLAVATSSDLPITVFYSGANTSTAALYQENGCKCGKYAQAPSTFELLQFGTPGATPTSPLIDLIIGAPGGAFVKYGQELADRREVISCGQPARFGKLVPVRDLTRGYFQCSPFVGTGACPGYQDAVLVAAKSLGGGSFEDPGTIRVIFGAAMDLSLDENLFDTPGATVELVPRPLPNQEDPRDPRTARVGDFNGDGNDDMAVLFGSTEEVHVWLGSGKRGLGETAKGITLDECDSAPVANQKAKCSPLRFFTLADFSGMGRPEIVVICDPTAAARLRRYTPSLQ